MKKSILFFLVALLIVSSVFSGCGQKKPETLDARDTLDAFIELGKKSYGDAFRLYGYDADPERSQEFSSRTGVASSDYNVMRWNQLSDKLYVAIVQHWAVAGNSEFMELNSVLFVGMIDGTYKVMGINSIPEDLKEGINLTRYQEYLDQFDAEMWEKIESEFPEPIEVLDAYYHSARMTNVANAFALYGCCKDAAHQKEHENDQDYIVSAQLLEWTRIDDNNLVFVAISEIRSKANDFEPKIEMLFVTLINKEWKVTDSESLPFDTFQIVENSKYAQYLPTS